MTTPLATIADALIEFILSLLRDPDAAAEFEQDPDGTLAANGLSDVCAEDVRAVAPVVVDRPDVHPHPHPNPNPNPNPPGPKPTPADEISKITQTFTIDNRATIVDQSVNQNIWANGDVNQIFDNEAVVNSGDHGTAAGEDADVDNSETDVDTGDIAVGNEDTTTNIDGSFNDESENTNTETEADIDDSFNDGSTEVETDIDTDDSFNETDVEVDNTVVAVNEGNIDVEGDASFDASAGAAVEPAAVEPAPEEYYEPEPALDVVEEQPLEMEYEEQQ